MVWQHRMLYAHQMNWIFLLAQLKIHKKFQKVGLWVSEGNHHRWIWEFWTVLKIANTCKILAEGKQKNILAAPSTIIYLLGTWHLCLELFHMFPIEYVYREELEWSQGWIYNAVQFRSRILLIICLEALWIWFPYHSLDLCW